MRGKDAVNEIVFSVFTQMGVGVRWGRKGQGVGTGATMLLRKLFGGK